MLHRLLTQVTSALLAATLLCPFAPAQQQKSQSTPSKTEQVGFPPLDPERARTLVERGEKEETIRAFPEALQDYDEAARYAPFDVTIVNKAVTLRSRLVREYVESSERFALQGNLDAATMDLALALHIDPNNTIVEERLQQMQSMREGEKSHKVIDEPAEGLARLEPDRSAVRSFNLRSDVKNAYEQIAAAYGVKAVFDPDLPGRPVHLRLTDVDFDTAINILAAETYTFWHALNTKTLFVAADTNEKRKAYDPEIEQTFLLPASVEATEITDLTRAVRELTGTTHIQQSAAAHTITMRDTVARVQLASALIHQMERARGEVLLEMDLLEVDRSLATKMGITPPSSVQAITISPTLIPQLQAATSVTAVLGILANLFGVSAGSASSLSGLVGSIPPFSLVGGGKSTFLLTLPSASVDFSEGLSLVRSGRQVLIRAQDQKPATFFVGDRYPITLSLLSNSLGVGAQTPTVGGTASTVILNDQFTVGEAPIALVSADLRNSGNLDLAVLNQTDNTVSILLNQGPNVTTQFVTATGSPISLATTQSGTKPIVSNNASLTVTSAATLRSITVTPVSSTIAVNTKQQFVATGKYSDGSSKNITTQVTWISSNNLFATIDSALGIASGVAPGTTQITATLAGIISQPVPLTVTSATLQSIAISPAAASIAIGNRTQFTALGTFNDTTTQDLTSQVTWASATQAVGIINSGGSATGLSAGATQISASLNGITSPSSALAVTSATLQSIAITPPSATVTAGITQQWTATGTFSDGTVQDVTASVRWSSSSTNVATIGASTGLATGVSQGTATITATQGGVGVPSAIAVGTLNANNNAFEDLLVAEQVTNSVLVLLGNGDGTFALQNSPIIVGNQPTAIQIGAFNTNNNTNLGFVVTNFADNTYTVFNGNADGTFTQVAGSPFAFAYGEKGPVAIAMADFNADGKNDLAIVNQATNNVSILLGNGDGTFYEPKTPIAVGNKPVAIAAGLLSGGTGTGLAVVNQQDATLSIFEGNNDGTFIIAANSPFATSANPTGVTIGALVAGGATGLAVSNGGAGTATVYADEGSGIFANVLETNAGTNPSAIVAGSFTGTGVADLVVTNDLANSPGQVTLLVSPASLLSNLGSGQTPYPGAEYEDIGIKIKATPSLHPNNEVTIQLELEIKAITGSNVNGIPIISNRSLTQMIRLKENETSIVGGMLDDEETKTLTGIPGLAQLPTVGYLFGSKANSFTNSELLILITPRRVRLPLRQSESIYAGRGDPSGRSGGGGGSVLAPVQTEPEPTPAPPAGEQPGQPAPTPTQPTPAPNPPQPNPQPPPDQPQPQPNPDDQPAPTPPPPR
jgi:Flp pilus assembly secretin CpaC